MIVCICVDGRGANVPSIEQKNRGIPNESIFGILKTSKFLSEKIVAVKEFILFFKITFITILSPECNGEDEK